LLKHDASLHTDLELDSYLTFQRSVPAAAKALISSEEWKRDHPVSIVDVAPFLRSPPGHSVPSACLACLEDMKGNVARDTHGRPIILMMGMTYGTQLELEQQVAYALNRARQYRLPHLRPDEVCFVVEVMSRETKWLPASFRIPDGPVRMLCDFMKTKYPGSQYSAIHFCGLPSFVVQFFKLVRPFVSDQLWSQLKLKKSFAHLKEGGHVAPSSLLPEWDKEGCFHFDLDMYVEWRAQVEGVSRHDLCPRGRGRQYDSVFSLHPSLTLETVLGIPNQRENVIKTGWAEKQGSGMGLFASNRWKPKYLVLQPGVLIYFESNQISKTNVASKWIPIDESSSVERRFSTENNKGYVVCLISAGREYLFGFKTEKEASDWMRVLQQQYDQKAATSDEDESIEPINPLKVSSLLVGDFILEHDQQLKATVRR